MPGRQSLARLSGITSHVDVCSISQECDVLKIADASSKKKTNKQKTIYKTKRMEQTSLSDQKANHRRTKRRRKKNKTFRYGCTSWGSKREPCLLNTTNAASTITVLAACTPQIGVDTCILKHLRLASNQSAESVVEPSRWKALQRADCCCCFFSLYFL